MTFDLAGVESVDIYARNKLKVDQRTFVVQLSEQTDASPLSTLLIRIIAGLIALTICCSTVVCSIRWLRKRNGLNYDVDEVDPDWDVDQVRVY